MRTLAMALSFLLLAACADGSDGTDGTTTTGWTAQDRAAIYAAVIGGNVKDPWIYDRICDNAGGNPSQSAGTCEAMDPQVRAALHELIPRARFTPDFDKIDQQIMEGGGGVLWRLGPVTGSGNDAKVSAAYYCGSLCAGGVTHVLTRVDGSWEETGTEGPEWIS